MIALKSAVINAEIFLSIPIEIAPWLHVFRAEDAVDFSQMTFDPGQKELIVGAR